METPLPNPDKFKPVNVDDSRAKRLERQHARMRNRGGIFRPENNNNLFDLLRSATHRKSPTKGRGRSRSRSISPQKKPATSNNSQKPARNKKSARRPTIHKTSVALAPVSEVAEGGIELQDERPRGKQKVNEVEDDTEQPSRVKAKRPATAKKSTTRKPRRTAKGSTPGGESEDACTNNKTRQTQPRPKGRRKKQGVGDCGPTDSKNPPHSSTITDKNSSNPSTTDDIVPERAIAKSQTKKTASQTQRQLINQPLVAEEPNDSIDKLPKLPPKTNSRKRKVENLETDDVSRPQKVLKPHSKSQESKAPSSECRPIPNELSNADLACKALEEIHVNRPCNLSKKSKRTAKSKLDEPVNLFEHSDTCAEKTEYKTALKTTMKRIRLPTEADGAPAMKVKKSKLDPSTDAFQSEAVVLHEPDSSRAKSTEKSDDTGRKRRKNIAAAGKKSRSGNGSRTNKQGSGLPAHIRQKLKAQRHEKHTSDDEPDPIDFLS